MSNVPTDESLTEPAFSRNSRLQKRPLAKPVGLPMARQRVAAMLRRNAKNC
jgi:hypothetical protein